MRVASITAAVGRIAFVGDARKLHAGALEDIGLIDRRALSDAGVTLGAYPTPATLR